MAVKRGDPDNYRYTLSACRGSACNAIALFHHSHGLTSDRAMHLRILRSHEVQLFPGAESITLGYQVYKGPPSPSWLHALIFSFHLPRPASIDFPPLSVTTKIKMASPSDTIVITDDEELPSLEPGSSRPRRAPRRDYSYREFENMIVKAVDETETTPSRKRKRTETKEPSALVPVFHKALFFLN
jgi:hypothetical protein